MPSPETEERLRRAFGRGDLLDLRTGDAEVDAVQNGADWPADRHVRADAIASLLLGGQPPVPGQVAMVRLAGARIVGPLELDGAEILSRLELTGCSFEHGIELEDARTRTITLDRCALPQLTARMARVDGNLIVGHCEIPHLDLLGARVHGILALSGSSMSGVDGCAVRADGLIVEGDLFLREGLRATAGLRLDGVVAGGDIDLSDAEVTKVGPSTA